MMVYYKGITVQCLWRVYHYYHYYYYYYYIVPIKSVLYHLLLHFRIRIHDITPSTIHRKNNLVQKI